MIKPVTNLSSSNLSKKPKNSTNKKPTSTPAFNGINVVQSEKAINNSILSKLLKLIIIH